MDISVNEKFPIEELFEQATEDTSHYRWAVEAWSDPPEGYEKDYLLILALTHRARSRMALELIDCDIPPDYKVYKERLEDMQRTAEKKLNELVLNDTDKIEHIIGTQLIERLNSLEELLQKVSKIAQDPDLIKDPDWVAEDLRDTSYDFVFQFKQLALTGEELNTNPFDTAVNSKSFQDQLETIDLHFQKCFGYFHAIRDMFPYFQKREYDRKCWWFERITDKDDIQGEENPESFIDKLKTKISEFLSPPIMPKPLPAIATACLVIIISVYALWNKPAMPPVTPASIEMILHGRTSIGFRGGETKYKEFLLGKSESLKSGDFFRVQIKLYQDTNVYIVFHDSTDKISGIKQGFIASGEEIFLPDRSNWYQLDNNLGQETIYVVASKNEIPDFDDKIKELKKDGIANIDQIFYDAKISSFPFRHE